MTHIIGRGAQNRPPNRFEKLHYDDDPELFDTDEEHLQQRQKPKTEYFVDTSRTIISENDSPDVPFRYSLNPYRGCVHGCAYCYARNTHEYLGLSAGLDFETKIFVKPDAPALFHNWLARDDYIPELVAFSGVTDCFQPIEKELQLTRECLKVACETGQPIGIVTKNRLVTRDLDLLAKMARTNTISVAISVTSLDQSLTRTMEPRTSSPATRLDVIRELSSAGVRVHLMAAPLIPGLNDEELPAILRAGAEAGAKSASYLIVRLPLTVQPVFMEWLRSTYPDKVQRVLSRIRSTRDGELNSSKWGERMKGTGLIADQIRQTFNLFTRKLGLNQKLAPLETSHFHPPMPKRGQLRLFA